MTTQRRRIRHVVFDLGGVLVEFRGVATLAARLNLDPGTMAELWLASPAVRAYERGGTDTETFITAAIAEFGGELTRAEFRAQMAMWLPGPLPGSYALLSELEANGVAHSCLSNTNAFHWQQMQSWGIDRTFRNAFLSHELGLVKPDREIFERLTHSLDLEPAEIVFFDDHPTNIKAASAFGLIAVQASGPQACRDWLVTQGLLT